MDENYGMMRAPKSAMASLVARSLFSLGTNIPIRTSVALGLAWAISAKKQPPMINRRTVIATSSFLIYKFEFQN